MEQKVIKERIEEVREELRREHLSAFVFSSLRPERKEYMVVTLKSVASWVNGVSEEAGNLTIAEWIGRELEDMADKDVGIDGMLNPVADIEVLKEALKHQGGITLRTNFNPLQRIWKDSIRPTPIEILPLELPDEEVRMKLTRIRRALREQHADGMLMMHWEDIVWTLNLKDDEARHYGDMAAFLLIASNQATIYINKVYVSESMKTYLSVQDIAIADSRDINKGLKDYFEYNILLDPQEVCYTLYQQVERKIVRGTSPVFAMRQK